MESVFKTRERSEMKIQTMFLTTALCAASVLVAVPGKGQTSDAPKADNTTVNKRDRDADQATAQDSSLQTLSQKLNDLADSLLKQAGG